MHFACAANDLACTIQQNFPFKENRPKLARSDLGELLHPRSYFPYYAGHFSLKHISPISSRQKDKIFRKAHYRSQQSLGETESPNKGEVAEL